MTLPSRAKALLSLALVALAAGTAACGGDDDSGETAAASAGGASAPDKIVIGYQALTDTALRGVVREALRRIEKQGLIAAHHFYLTFDTQAPGVQMPARLWRTTLVTDSRTT